MAEPASRFVAACVQMRSGRDPAVNRDAAVAALREAAERDRSRLFEVVRSESEDATLAALRDVARQTNLVVHVGSLAVRNGDKIANRAFLIDADGEIRAAYDKLHLYDVDLPDGESWRESATYTGGDCAVVADLPWARLGLTICYDLRFPAVYRALAEAGATVLTAPACFTRQTGEAHWHVLQRARAIETGSFMISAAQGGRHEDGRETYGHSLIVDPWGRVIAESDGAEPGVIWAEIDLARVGEARGRIPALAHARPFTVRHA